MHTSFPMRQDIIITILYQSQNVSSSIHKYLTIMSYRRAGTVVWFLFSSMITRLHFLQVKPSHSYSTGSIVQECEVLYLVMESMYAAQVTLLFRANRKISLTTLPALPNLIIVYINEQDVTETLIYSCLTCNNGYMNDNLNDIHIRLMYVNSIFV